MNQQEKPVERGQLCPVCAASTTTFFRREQVPVHQNLPMPSREAARSMARGDLDLAFCASCGFIHNSAFDLDKLSYDEDYDNTQSCSTFFLNYLDDLVQYLVNEKGVRGRRIVEVGCGKGLFLRKLVEADSGNFGYGFDPAYEGPLVELDGRLNFQRTFYGPQCADVFADVIVCRHVIEHVPRPVELLQTIRGALLNSPQARLFFETPDVTWILRHKVIWDFFYEHCSYFTPPALKTAFERAGFSVESIRPVFGEQYLWLEAALSPDAAPPAFEIGNSAQLAEEFTRCEADTRQRWIDQVQKLSKRGGVALWGAGAKGVTLANLIDPDCQLIRCVIDLNPVKQGRFLPGTGHPIIGVGGLAAQGVKSAILMNPNYREENLRLLREHELKINLVDLTD